ncbi:hypothetical protein [Tenacibaculum sp. 190524A02b]|uniref:hypothetical protein n=1 Tax=Tenacibaculum vairaonense TaxID=3137860 RepID=UPI0031FB393E
MKNSDKEIKEEIKTLFASVEDKEDLYEYLATKYRMSKSSIRTNWFSKWEIPIKYNLINLIKKDIEKYLEKQKKPTAI